MNLFGSGSFLGPDEHKDGQGEHAGVRARQHGEAWSGRYDHELHELQQDAARERDDELDVAERALECDEDELPTLLAELHKERQEYLDAFAEVAARDETLVMLEGGQRFV